MIEGAPFPAIEKVYDPSSKKCNGRITPQAPIVITGHHLDMLTWDSANLYLVSSPEKAKKTDRSSSFFNIE